jgi:serine/threonine protein kinase
MLTCSACGASAIETARFCPACGAELPGPAVDVTAATAVPLRAGGSADAGLIGTIVDGFAIDAALGGGAFGTVYQGRQLGLDRPVAIKVPTHEIAADPIMARRFAREARAASRVTHPGVVAIYAVGELPDQRPYLAMQLVQGEPLDRVLAAGPIDPARALRLARMIASALAETHAAGVIHRDLKPSNIMWRRDRLGDDRVVLVDFGIAVANPGTADATRLTAGGLIGTPSYMSPEQAHGEVVDGRADLYSLGCLLHELLTGEPPFTGSSYEVLLAHLGRPAPAPSARSPGVPPAVDALATALMAKRPEDRPATADVVVGSIDAALGELESPAAASRARGRSSRASTRPPSALAPSAPSAVAALRTSTASPITAPPRSPRRAGARARDIAIGALAAALLGGGVVGGARLLERSPPAEPAPEPGTRRRELPLLEEGDTRLRVWIPDPMRIRASGHRVFFELRNKLGAILRAETIVVTVEDPAGKATGVLARPRRADPHQLSFHHPFSLPGAYRVRVFPGETPSDFSFRIDVAP